MRNYPGILLREQKGLALPLALAMLAIGSLIVVPLLNLTETSLRSGIREENRIDEHYAANAGVNDGLLQIITDDPSLPAVGDNWSYSIPDTNNRSVDVTISTTESKGWDITSTATGGNGNSTELNAHIEQRGYLKNAIVSTSVTLDSGATIKGHVQYDSTLGVLINNGTIDGEVIDKPIDWPTTAEVEAFYLDQVDGAPINEGDLILDLGPETVGNPYSLGPIYIDGDLTINTPSNGAFRLDGTVYVTGSVTINGVRMYQNDNNLYANGSITLQASSSAYGAGGIVARNNINVLYSTTAKSYSIIWSLEGSISCNPTGHLRGMLYSGELNSNGNLTIWSGVFVDYEEPSSDLLLPPLPGIVFKIVSWESSTQ